MAIPKTFKVASWNIAGGRPARSLEAYDYHDEDLAYFAEELRKIGPDVVCLQETHTSPDRAVSKELSKLLGWKYCYDAPMSPSHVDPDYQLGVAMLWKSKPDSVSAKALPDPGFHLYFKDGRRAATHHKGIQVAHIGNMTIANMQLLPISIFGKSYDQDEGLEFARQIEKVLLGSLRTPLVFAGDFNYDGVPEETYRLLYEKFALHEALPHKQTRPREIPDFWSSPDHITYSSGVVLRGADVVKTDRTDHYLCWAEFELA
ncbi:MAG TPA: endonuclease/exonuclease/phosphatase family protein [Candidatus Saccharimonadia bacterium]|nr:endonuclease/exonuclease/phosphatase family protein [Candidatus Saccharimonadia bacterium]